MTPIYEASTQLLVGQNSTSEVSDTARRPIEFIASQARIAESDDVVRTAIEHVGLKTLGLDESPRSVGIGAKLRVWLAGGNGPKPITVSPIDVAIPRLTSSITVKTEPNSDLLRISFRHSDPSVAALFTNALAQAFIDRQSGLSSRPGAVDFFREQTKRFDDEVKHRSAVLQDFVTKQKLYSIDDQRKLLLKRASDLSAALATARASLAEKRGQKSTLVSQLKLLKPVTQSSYVSGLVDTLGGEDRGTRSTSAERTPVGDPPLLMVKVYQDSMVSLFKINADITGNEDLINQQESEMKGMDAQLRFLADQEASFEKLKRDVTLATANSEIYSKRATEEEIDRELRVAKLSSARIIGRASIPLRAVFPKGIQFAGLGLALGIILGLFISTLCEMIYFEREHLVDPSHRADAITR